MDQGVLYSFGFILLLHLHYILPLLCWYYSTSDAAASRCFSSENQYPLIHHGLSNTCLSSSSSPALWSQISYYSQYCVLCMSINCTATEVSALYIFTVAWHFCMVKIWRGYNIGFIHVKQIVLLWVVIKWGHKLFKLNRGGRTTKTVQAEYHWTKRTQGHDLKASAKTILKSLMKSPSSLAGFDLPFSESTEK